MSADDTPLVIGRAYPAAGASAFEPSPTATVQASFGARLYTQAEMDAALAVARERATQWRSLYLRAVNEANGLTNYVEDRPELRRAERNLTAIEAAARALESAGG